MLVQRLHALLLCEVKVIRTAEVDYDVNIQDLHAIATVVIRCRPGSVLILVSYFPNGELLSRVLTEAGTYTVHSVESNMHLAIFYNVLNVLRGNLFYQFENVHRYLLGFQRSSRMFRCFVFAAFS